MLRHICDCNNFVIFLENISFWVKFRSEWNNFFHYLCPFGFAFKYELNSSAQVLAFWATKNNVPSAPNCLAVNTIWYARLLRPKKVVLFPVISQVKIFNHLPACISQVCMRIYTFCFQKNTKFPLANLFIWIYIFFLQKIWRFEKFLKIWKIQLNYFFFFFAAAWVKIFFINRISGNISFFFLA